MTDSKKTCNIVAKFFVCLLLLLGSQTAGALESQDYQLGRGYNIPSTGLTIGGYMNINYQWLEDSNDQFKLDDFSVFLSWRAHSRLFFFSELELEEPLTVDNSGLHHDNYRFNLERFYADLLLTEQATLRIGKFLTPVGRWNIIHATPLVWTVERPLVTDSIAFSTHGTGLMLHGTVGFEEIDIDYNIYLDDTKDLDPKINIETSFRNAIGGYWRVNFLNGLQIGASYINFINFAELDGNHSQRRNLFGIDFFWARQGYELSAELVYQQANQQQARHKGGFAQAVVPIWDQFYAIGRYEYFDNHDTANDLHLGLVGLAYRPTPPLVFKLEYRLGHNNEPLAPSGLFSSIAVLF